MRSWFLILISLFFSFNLIANKIEKHKILWEKADFLGFDPIDSKTGPDLTTVFKKNDKKYNHFRLQFFDFNKLNSDIKIKIRINNNSWFTLYPASDKNVEANIDFSKNRIEFITSDNDKLQFLFINILKNDIIIDEYYWNYTFNQTPANAAFVHHGNQGLTYSSVFYGDEPISNSGFDEVLEIHQNTNIPGNFHLSATLMSAAQWHQPEFNDWLATGVYQGWISMVTSAFGQHIMPFVTDEMNNWSIAIENNMIEFLYGYTPRVAWIPERVWLSPGYYPENGVIDWPGDNFTQHGVDGIVLDGWPHCNNYSSTKIHWMNNENGIVLRVIPINSDFVGNVHYNAGGAINQIQNTGEYDILIYGNDWEFVAEMNEYANTNLLDNYETIINWCSQNYPAVNIWKLDAALDHSDFNGQGIELTNGTYGSIGGLDGYGGNNNAWYSNWAATASLSDHHDPAWNYGMVWSDAYNNLMNQPNNEISQLGWYTMMVNLHETGWHDYMGGPISGWEHHYSSHIKNSNVYAEMSRWSAGLYPIGAGTFQSDIDHDGINELIMHNNKLFAVFESIGGKINWMIIKDEYGNSKSVIGSDVAYWSETDGDYNEDSHNHFAALSDVYPNNQHNLYSFEIIENNSDYVKVKLAYWGVEKTISLNDNNQFLDISYNFFGNTGFVKSGWSPDLMDLIWSGKEHIQRIWGESVAYLGHRNSSSGATVSIILGDGGASHQNEFEGTLVKGDEIFGPNRFNIKLFAGFTDEPYDEYNSRLAVLDEISSLSMAPESYVFWSPEDPIQGHEVIIRYDHIFGVLNGIDDSIYIHIGINGWQNILEPDPLMYYQLDNNLWEYMFNIPDTAYSINFAFNNGQGYWDNNGGQDWYIIVNENDSIIGDINIDGIVNIVDVVLIINDILGNISLPENQFFLADLNIDGIVNIVDIIIIVDIILSEN